jgi:hypothetical protein
MFNVGKPIEPCLVSQDKNKKSEGQNQARKIIYPFQSMFSTKKTFKNLFSE